MREVLSGAGLPQYQSHKKVWALKITQVDYLGTDTTTDESLIVMVHFDAPFAPKRFNLRGKPTPEAGWYWITYPDGYISFSPAAAFEEGYTPVPKDHKERVLAEKRELDEKIGKLKTFFGNSIYAGINHDEQDRINEQLAAMHRYSEILADRIENF